LGEDSRAHNRKERKPYSGIQFPVVVSKCYVNDVNPSDQFRVSYNRIQAPGRRFPTFSSAPAAEKFEDPHMPTVVLRTPYLEAYVMSTVLVQSVTIVHELTFYSSQYGV
jgi:hypothetical protein